MDCSALVDKLLQCERLVSLLPQDATGHPAIYQILSPQADLFPRIAVFESGRAFTRFCDDLPMEERTEYRVDLYAKENVLQPLAGMVDAALLSLDFARVSQVQDDYLPELAVFVKSLTYEHYQTIWEG